MIALLQRVQQANVMINDVKTASIGLGLLVLLGIERKDTPADADKLLRRVLGYRIFSDDKGKMNQSLQDIKGELLIVPQFTLPADTHKGMRPSFTPAAPPDLGLQLFNYFHEQASQNHTFVKTGQFGADMQVSLTNDGPVTFWLQT